MFSFCKEEGFEFSHSPGHAFTSGAIYCLKLNSITTILQLKKPKIFSAFGQIRALSVCGNFGSIGMPKSGDFFMKIL